jgi:uncharacterized protein (TIGR01777 family)
MHIFITGGTGLIGSHLTPLLHQHTLTLLTRNKKNANAILGDKIKCVSALNEVNFNEIDVIINLAGEPIVGKRWSDHQKTRLINSRVVLTEDISNAIKACDTPPHTFISGSAIGYYGRQQNTLITERFDRPHHEFSHQLCKKWEEAALKAESNSTRVCVLRTGIVLAKNGGALGKMLPAFKLGLGGPIADGEQGMSWIHINDMTQLIYFIINTPTIKGPINATAPHPVSNAKFSRALGDALSRPTWFRVPRLALNIAMGEMAVLLTTGQFVRPEKALEHNYAFSYPTIKSALNDILKPNL